MYGGGVNYQTLEIPSGVGFGTYSLTGIGGGTSVCNLEIFFFFIKEKQ